MVWGYSPTCQWGERAGLATGSPWGGCQCRVAPVVDLAAAHLLWDVQLPPSVGGGHTLCQFSCSHQGQAKMRLFTCSLGFCIFCVWAYFGPSLPMWIYHSEKWHDGDTCAVDSVGVFKCLRRKSAGAWFPFSPINMNFFLVWTKIPKSHKISESTFPLALYNKKFQSLLLS